MIYREKRKQLDLRNERRKMEKDFGCGNKSDREEGNWLKCMGK